MGVASIANAELPQGKKNEEPMEFETNSGLANKRIQTMDRDQQKLGRKLALPEMLVLLVSKFVWPTKNREELWLGICVLLTSPKNGSLSGFFVPITRGTE